MIVTQSPIVWPTVLILIQTASGASQNDGCLVQFSSPVKYTISCRHGTTECSNQALQSEFPDLYNSSIWRAPAPASFTPEATCQEDPDAKINRSAIVVTWKLPDDRGASLIKGFDIRVQGHVREFRCIVVKLEEKVKSSGMSFSGVMTSVDHSSMYRITLQSLPRNNVSGMLHDDVRMKGCVAAQHSGSWAVEYFNISYDHVTRELHVAFKRPPDRFSFEEFKVTLLSKAMSKSHRINETQYTFEGISPGEYEILVIPIDPYIYQRGLCKCKNKRGSCGTCTLSKGQYTAKPGVTKDNIQAKPADTNILIIGMVVGCVCIVAVAIVVIMVCRGELRIPFVCQGQIKDSKDKTNTVLVFIDPSYTNSTADDKKRFAIESYRQRLQEETHVYVAEHTIKTLYNVRETLEELLTDISNVKRETETNCRFFEVCKNGMLPSRPASVDNTIVRCFVLSDRMPPMQLANLITLDKIYTFKVVNVALKFDKVVVDNLQSFGPIKSFKIPEEHDDFVKYIYVESSCKDASSDATKSIAYKTGDASLKVNIDGKYSTNENEALVTDRHVTPTIGQLINGRRPVTNSSGHVSPLPSRERYVSNDSGKGGSVESYRCSLEENEEEAWELGYNYNVDDSQGNPSNNFPDIRSGELSSKPRCPSDLSFCPPEDSDISEIDHLMTDRQRYTPKICHEIRLGDLRPPFCCPSDLYFIPPEPSDISESDIFDSYRSEYKYARNGYIPMQNCRQAIAEDECIYTCDSAEDDIAETSRNAVSRAGDDSSVDMLMSKMAAINRRTMRIMSVDAQAGDTFTVFEENV